MSDLGRLTLEHWICLRITFEHRELKATETVAVRDVVHLIQCQLSFIADEDKDNPDEDNPDEDNPDEDNPDALILMKVS